MLKVKNVNIKLVLQSQTVFFIVASGDCRTTDYIPCTFPFTYKNKTHYGCTDVDDSKKWCATDSDEFGTFKSYGECVGNCKGGMLVNLEIVCFGQEN